MKSNMHYIEKIYNAYSRINKLPQNTSKVFIIIGYFLFFHLKNIKISELKYKILDENNEDKQIRNFTIQEILKNINPHGAPVAYAEVIRNIFIVLIRILVKKI